MNLKLEIYPTFKFYDIFSERCITEYEATERDLLQLFILGLFLVCLTTLLMRSKNIVSNNRMISK
jgi:hypothetical protein